MKALLLAALFSSPASAAVVETAVTAAPAAPVTGAYGAAAGASSVMTVPAASVLAPSLNAGAFAKAFAGDPAAAPTMFAPAPAPAAPAAPAAAKPAPGAQDARGTPAAPRESVPPGALPGGRSAPAAAVARRREAPSERAVSALAARLDAASVAGPEAPDAEAARPPISDDDAAGDGRRLFDRSADRAALAGGLGGAPNDGFSAGARGSAVGAEDAATGETSRRPAAALTEFRPGNENLRDAVASPAAGPLPRAALFAPAPGAAFRALLPSAPAASFTPTATPAAAGPRSSAPAFERLSLELGSGLIVKVRGAMGLSRPSEPAAFSGASAGSSPAAVWSAALRSGPAASTEWMERRGLLESLSASEAAAVQVARLPEGVPSSSRFAAPPAPAPSEPGLPAAAWSLAFLPAALFLLKKLA